MTKEIISVDFRLKNIDVSAAVDVWISAFALLVDNPVGVTSSAVGLVSMS